MWSKFWVGYSWTDEILLHAFILCATEALPLSNRIISVLDSCVSKTTAKIFSVTHGDNIVSVRQLVNLRRLTEVIEKRKQKFMDRLLQLDYFTVVLNVYSANVFLWFYLLFLFIMCIAVLS